MSMSSTYRITLSTPPSSVVRHALREFGTFEFATSRAGQSTLIGTVVDESALYGALQRLQNLHVELLEVLRVEHLS
ncbi:MAG TPA: hypothetical protein VL068_10110 [Microthrixaceae bacterium]|nr:hypothetical protein [Microthrixaceae bacterium]